jgi:hypothetical protein
LTRLTSASPTSTGGAIGVDANGDVVRIAAATSGGPLRLQSGVADIKYFALTGTPVVTFNNTAGVGTIAVTGGTIELDRVQLTLTNTDLNSNAYTLVAPTTQSGTFVQYPHVEKWDRQLDGLPTGGFEHINDKDSNPQIQVDAATPGTSITVKVININNMNTNCALVYKF